MLLDHHWRKNGIPAELKVVIDITMKRKNALGKPPMRFSHFPTTPQSRVPSVLSSQAMMSSMTCFCFSSLMSSRGLAFLSPPSVSDCPLFLSAIWSDWDSSPDPACLFSPSVSFSVALAASSFRVRMTDFFVFLFFLSSSSFFFSSSAFLYSSSLVLWMSL